VAVVVLAWVLSRIVRPRPDSPDSLASKPGHELSATEVSFPQQTQSAMTAVFVLGTAYALGAPYALPWYDLLTWATLPLMLGTALDWILLARLTVLAMAYVPGRVVAMSAGVETLTLGFRKIAGPLAAWMVLLAIAGVARRGWSGGGLPTRRRMS